MDYPETTPWRWADLAVYPRGSIFIRLVARESVKSMRAWVSQKIKNWRSTSIRLFTTKEEDSSSGGRFWKVDHPSAIRCFYFRLQHSPYFWVFKYARTVEQKVRNEAENRERDSYATLYRFLYWFWEKTDCFAVYFYLWSIYVQRDLLVPSAGSLALGSGSF